MTALEVLTQLSRYNGIDIADELCLDWLNLFQQDLAFYGTTSGTQVYTDVVAGTAYNLPTDFVSLIRAVNSLSEIIDNDDIELGEDSTISFSEDDDSISVKYIKTPTTLTSINNDLTVHKRFHEIAYFYLLSMYYDMEGEGDTEESVLSERYLKRYEFRKNQIIAELRMGTSGPLSTKDVLPKRTGIVRSTEEFY